MTEAAGGARPESPKAWSRREPTEILVGMLVIVALAFTVLYLYGGKRLRPEGGYVVSATFNRVDGLALGGEVRLSGIRVGTVDGEALDSHYRAVLNLRLDSDVKLPADTAAAIHTDGLFGSKFVVLDPGGDPKILGPGEAISFTQDAVAIGQLLDLIIAQGRARLKAPNDTKAKEGG